MTFVNDCKYAILVDTSYLYRASKQIEKEARVDYSKLKAVIDDSEIQYSRLIAFVVDVNELSDTDTDKEELSRSFHGFAYSLEAMGYEVVLCKPRQEGSYRRTDCSVPIAVHAMQLAEKVDGLLIVSGVGDLYYIAETLRPRIRVDVMAFQRMIDKNLKRSCSEMIELTESILKDEDFAKKKIFATD